MGQPNTFFLENALKAHYRLCAAVFHQWLHEYYPLKRQLFQACRRNTYLWRLPTNNSTTVLNRASAFQCIIELR